jgi:hypothetical protein
MDKLTNFRTPTTRDGVIFLFGKVGEELNIYVEEMRAAFPAGLARRYTGSGWEKVRIEFEYKSADFKKKGLDPAECDIIVCWENNWPDCPIEVIELEDRLASLPDKPVTPPDANFESFLDTLFDSLKVNDNIRRLMKSVDRQLKNIDARIWMNASSITHRRGRSSMPTPSRRLSISSFSAAMSPLRVSAITNGRAHLPNGAT